MNATAVTFDLDFVLATIGALPVRTEVRAGGRGVLALGANEVVWAFDRSARRTELRGECWWYTGYPNNGYGVVSIRNGRVYLHVLSCVVAHGPLAKGEEVCHTCDNRACWNPAHLFKGTRLDNVRDMWAKGRAVKPPRVTGERQHLATLTDDDVAQIRAMTGVPQRDVAKAFDCSQSTVWRLRHGRVRNEAS